MALKYYQTQPEASPGPGDYDPEVKNTKAKPSIKYSCTPRRETGNSFSIPGPGRYQTISSYLEKKGGKFGKSQKKSEVFECSSEDPGPGAYDTTREKSFVARTPDYKYIILYVKFQIWKK